MLDTLLAFLAALVSARLAARLLARWRARRRPELAAWTAALASFAIASAALAWASAAGWSDAAFRVYYLFGGLLTAALLGVGSLLLVGRRWAAPLGLLYAGLAVGIALAVPLSTVTGTEIPDSADHLELVPARLVAVFGNSLGTVAVVAVAAATIRRRPLGNGLIVAGVAVAAAGSALFGLGVASTAVSLALAALLLYAGFVAPAVAKPDGHAERREDRGRDDLHDQADGSAVGDDLHGGHPKSG